MKMYGNIINRLEENQKEIPTLEVGMKLTEYLWSDREVYEITKVINQKDVFIRRMDAINKDKCMGSQNWELVSNENRPSFEIVFRYNNWYKKDTYTKETLKKMMEEDGCILLSDDIVKEIENKGVAYRYNKMNKLRFGTADYYYDWEF